MRRAVIGIRSPMRRERVERNGIDTRLRNSSDRPTPGFTTAAGHWRWSRPAQLTTARCCPSDSNSKRSTWAARGWKSERSARGAASTVSNT